LPITIASATSVCFTYTGNGSALEEGSALVDVSALGVATRIPPLLRAFGVFKGLDLAHRMVGSKLKAHR